MVSERILVETEELLFTCRALGYTGKNFTEIYNYVYEQFGRNHEPAIKAANFIVEKLKDVEKENKA